MRETPKTDAFGERSLSDRASIALTKLDHRYVVALQEAFQSWNNFARQLERNLNTANARIAELEREKAELAAQVVVLSDALKNLKEQVDAFCETQGEADFYTGEAVNTLSNLPVEAQKILAVLEAAGGWRDQWSIEVNEWNIGLVEFSHEDLALAEAIRAWRSK